MKSIWVKIAGGLMVLALVGYGVELYMKSGARNEFTQSLDDYDARFDISTAERLQESYDRLLDLAAMVKGRLAGSSWDETDAAFFCNPVKDRAYALVKAVSDASPDQTQLHGYGIAGISSDLSAVLQQMVSNVKSKAAKFYTQLFAMGVAMRPYDPAQSSGVKPSKAAYRRLTYSGSYRKRSEPGPAVETSEATPSVVQSEKVRTREVLTPELDPTTNAPTPARRPTPAELARRDQVQQFQEHRELLLLLEMQRNVKRSDGGYLSEVPSLLARNAKPGAGGPRVTVGRQLEARLRSLSEEGRLRFRVRDEKLQVGRLEENGAWTVVDINGGRWTEQDF